MQQLLVDLLDEALELLALDVDEDDLDDVGELLLVHLFHEHLLVPLDLLFLLGELALWSFEQFFALGQPKIVVLLEIIDELAEPAESFVVALANELLLRGLVLQEPVQLDDDFLVKLQAARLLHLKVLKEEIELVEGFLAELRLQLKLIVEVALNNRKQLEEEARHAVQNVDVGDGVQRLDPLNEYNLTLFVDACLQFLANGVDQLIQVKLEALVE